MKSIATQLILIFLLGMSTQATANSRCQVSVATAFSIQGNVAVPIRGEWANVNLGDTFCIQDVVRVGKNSRALVRLAKDQTNILLDQNSSILFGKDESESWVNLIKGNFYSISRSSHTMRFKTPDVNATVEGSEIFVEVTDKTTISVREGRINLLTDTGPIVVTGGQTVVVKIRQKPKVDATAKPDQATQWALYYPPILYFNKDSFCGAEKSLLEIVAQAILLANRGKYDQAIDELSKISNEVHDPRLEDYYASLLLRVGRIEQVHDIINRNLDQNTLRSNILAIQSIIAGANNQKIQALELAQRAVNRGDTGAAAFLALSYAQQAMFNSEAALSSATNAALIDPTNAFAASRAAELWIALGNMEKAQEFVQRATVHAPNLADTQTLMGFVQLNHTNMIKAKQAFEKAIQLDQSTPMPRIGLGLTMIRYGDLIQGREQLEVATSLSPQNALIRNYIAKTYIEEEHNVNANDQISLAKQLDPNDPTSWFYSAILKRIQNRPIESLLDLQRSIELNDNRIVNRSGLLLEEDLAARNVNLAGIYTDLGFGHRALMEGWNWVTTHPGNYSGHRFLADSYALLPRHEIARVSELLQAQLLQPLNVGPILAQSSESNLGIARGLSPTDTSSNENTSLFIQDGHKIQTSLASGSYNTFGDDLAVSGLYGRYLYNASQYHYQTEGIRKNSDLQHDIYSIFSQVALSPKVNIQTEIRRKQTRSGDTTQRFDLDNFSPNLHIDRTKNSGRLGFHYAPDYKQDIIASVLYDTDEKERTDLFETIDTSTTTYDRVEQKINSTQIDAQHQFHWRYGTIITGFGTVIQKRKIFQTTQDNVDATPQETNIVVDSKTQVEHNNIYIYAPLDFIFRSKLILGASYDGYGERENNVDKIRLSQFNPKIGVTWTPIGTLIIRAAALRTLKRPLASNQTIEPTQLAGFNQFYDDLNTTQSTKYGIGVDHNMRDFFYGLELSKRDLTKQVREISTVDSTTEENQTDPTETIVKKRTNEEFHRAYLYKTLWKRLSMGMEIQYEKFKRDFNPGNLNLTDPYRVDTLSLPLSLKYFDPNGLFINFDAAFVEQKIGLVTEEGTNDKSTNFWIFNLITGIRMEQHGYIKFGIYNLLDRSFAYHSMNIETGEARESLYLPERSVVMLLNVSF